MLNIEGERIALRNWRIEDLDRYEYWLRPGHEWQRLDGPYYARPSMEDIDALIDRKRRELEQGAVEGTPFDMPIVRRESGRLVGRVSHYWISRETEWLALGISLYDPNDWRRGFGYEALGLWSESLFEWMPELVRLDLRTWSGNAGMMALALKLGYREEARFRKARLVDGAYYDGMGYGVLREEWRELYPNGFARHLAERIGSRSISASDGGSGRTSLGASAGTNDRTATKRDHR
jgi:putative hydrolase of HD superfamily